MTNDERDRVLMFVAGHVDFPERALSALERLLPDAAWREAWRTVSGEDEVERAGEWQARAYAATPNESKGT